MSEMAENGACAPSASVIELAGPNAVEEALPLVSVIDQNPALRVTGYPHQDPLGVGTLPADKRDLHRAVALARALPLLGGDVDAKFSHSRLAAHQDRPNPSVRWQLLSISVMSASRCAAV